MKIGKRTIYHKAIIPILKISGLSHEEKEKWMKKSLKSTMITEVPNGSNKTKQDQRYGKE